MSAAGPVQGSCSSPTPQSLRWPSCRQRRRQIIEAAAEVYVLTPTLPGRLAWRADDVDRCRHMVDERFDTVLGHMHSIGSTPAERPAVAVS
jgi:hypothetical protein